MTSDLDLIEYLHDRVCEGSVILAVETDRTGDPQRYRIGIRTFGVGEHKEYVASDFRQVLEDALSGHDEFLTENRLELWGELDQPPSEEVEAVVACLGDDAAQLREQNDEDERAANMDEAASLLIRLERANRQLHEMGCTMYAELERLRSPASPSQPMTPEHAQQAFGHVGGTVVRVGEHNGGDYDMTHRTAGVRVDAPLSDEWAAKVLGFTDADKLSTGQFDFTQRARIDDVLRGARAAAGVKASNGTLTEDPNFQDPPPFYDNVAPAGVTLVDHQVQGPNPSPSAVPNSQG
jgi:hypothetical protein